MPNPAAIWRVTCGCIGALLLLTPLRTALTADSVHSTLIYSNGREFKTDFFDAHLLAELPIGDNEGPLLVFSGRPDGPCAPPGCYAETSVYFQSATDKSGKFSVSPFAYPGNYYAGDKLVARVRMFVGRCIDLREGVAWFIQDLGNRTLPDDSPFSAPVIFVSVGDRWNGYPAMELLTHVDVPVAEAAAAGKVCNEISPRPTIVLPVDLGRTPYPNPIIDDLFGNFPDPHVKRWMKFVVTMWPTFNKKVYFSPENLKSTKNQKESFIVLPRPAYDRLVKLMPSPSCVGALPVGGMIWEHHDDETDECWLSPRDYCDYLAAISTLPEMRWTVDEAKLIRDLSFAMRCKDSGPPASAVKLQSQSSQP